jgi:hypothetical protein
MKYLTCRVGLALSALLVLSLTLAAPASANPKQCENVRGPLAGQSTGPDSFESVLTGDLEGILIGTNFEIVKVGEDGTLHFIVDHEFTTTRGTFYTVAEGVLSPIGPDLFRTSERNFFLPGGTGDFVGATGTLLIQSEFSASGEFAGQYHGRICTPE